METVMLPPVVYAAGLLLIFLIFAGVPYIKLRKKRRMDKEEHERKHRLDKKKWAA